ncbi:MAG: hypothetical protein LW768_21730 [Rubrivivax sp.]|jgi:hypothetical protein|nr:hypothetical protein [Rubrivivax sp.]
MSEWKSPRKWRLSDALPKSIAPDSLPATQAKARSLGAEYELPTVTVVSSSQSMPARCRAQLGEGGVQT